MKKHTRLSSFRMVRLACAAGAVWLLAAAPAQAQWLVQDERLWKLIKNEVVDDQLKNINKKLQKHLDRIDVSGKEVTPYDPAGKPGDKNDKFHQLEFPISPNDLLAPGGDHFDQYLQDTKKYIGENGYGPNCNPEEKEKRSELFENCLLARNIMGSQLKALHVISQTLEARNKKLHSLMTSNEYKTTGELQKKQYEISALQAMMLNDMARIQTIQAAFNTTRDMYNMRKEEEIQAKATGKPALNADGTKKPADSPDLGKIAAQKAGRAALIASLHAAANADNNKSLKDKSSVAGKTIEQIIDKGLGFLAK